MRKMNDNIQINIRNRRFTREAGKTRWWLNGDPYATAWFNALSLSFPRGEALFIDSVKRFRNDAPPKLAAEIRAFIQQEVNHTREHLAFNRHAEVSGYQVDEIDRRIAALVAEVQDRPPVVWLAITMALEHFTAMFAHEFLHNPHHFFGTEDELAELWRWHSVEEIEHKAVAYDTWLHATRDWPARRRWWVRSLTMLHTTGRFLKNRTNDALDLLGQDGITGWRARLGLWHYLLVKPGMIRRVIPAWARYFKPGFHPWDVDDRRLIDKYDSEFTDALMPAE